jgi:hypothetical protein
VRSTARNITVAGALVSAVCVAVLHVVRSDVPPVGHRLSEYAIGPYGWLMTVAFVALGVGLSTLGYALLREPPRGATWIVAATGMFAGIGMIVSGIFETGAAPPSDVIHSRASISSTIAVVGLALVQSMPSARRWSDAPRDRLSIALALAAAALTVIAPVFHDSRWAGLSQRLLWLVVLLWVMGVLVRQPSRPAGVAARAPSPP